MAIAVAAAFLPAIAPAQHTLRPPPAVLRTVNDEAGILTSVEAAKLSAELQQARAGTGVRMTLVIMPTTRPERLTEYAQRLARRWLRERAVDPSRMIIVVVAMEDRQMQIMPGRALRLNEALHRDDPTRRAAPYFSDGRYFDGLMVLTAGIREVIEKNSSRR